MNKFDAPAQLGTLSRLLNDKVAAGSLSEAENAAIRDAATELCQSGTGESLMATIINGHGKDAFIRVATALQDAMLAAHPEWAEEIARTLKRAELRGLDGQSPLRR